LASDPLPSEGAPPSSDEGSVRGGTGARPALGRPSQASYQEPLAGAHVDASSAGYSAAGGSTGWCTLRGATVTGVRHRLAGEPNEDSFSWAVGDGIVALAVTDGLGSVEGSRGAASAAASAAVLAAVGEEGEAPELSAVRAANEACSGGGATTLVVAVVGRGGDVRLARVGDSTAFFVEPDGSTWREVFEPGEPDEGTVDVTTAALPAVEPEIERASVSVAPGQVLVLASDGIGDPWRDGPTTVAPAFAALVAAHPDPLDLAAVADFSRHGCHDDRTIMLLWV
jgi:serine/threonine protein phosphatase PrpC